MRRWILFIIGSVSLVMNASIASINSDLTHFFNGLGYSTNTTSPNVYQGQQAGFYSGGSVFARSSVRDVQIANVQLPSFRSGCGGIDLYTGGFSFINSKELVATMKNVANNAAGYAFNLALEETMPQVASSMKYFNTLASDINRMNINSCEMGAGLVGSFWPKTHAAQQQVCQDVGTHNGIFSDYASARQGCSAGGEMASTLNNASGPYKNLALKNINIAWAALQQNSLFSGDTELAELFMSLSGTVIINNPGQSDSSQQEFRVLSSLSGDPTLLKALLHGGTAKIYACNTVGVNGCLNPSTKTITVSPSHALEAHVRALLTDMADKLFLDQKLTDEEIGLLNATRLPVYKILNVQAAYAGKSVLGVENYSEVIATDLLFQYLNEALKVVRTSSSSLQYPESIMQAFDKSISDARQMVRAAEQNAYAQVNMTAQLIEQTQALEQMLAGQLSTHLSNTISWANHMRGQQS